MGAMAPDYEVLVRSNQVLKLRWCADAGFVASRGHVEIWRR